jgi:hypothetical protein
MSEKSILRMDASAAGLLLLWAGLALGFVVFSSRILPLAGDVMVAGRIVAFMAKVVDWSAWIAFVPAILLVWGSRWLAEVEDHAPVGPQRLWVAAGLTALLACFASSFIMGPKLVSLRIHLPVPIEQLPEQHPDRAAYRRVHSLARQLFAMRLLLALGLAAGVSTLPRRK